VNSLTTVEPEAVFHRSRATVAPFDRGAGSSIDGLDSRDVREDRDVLKDTLLHVCHQ
jgi:hypothetical protein